MWPDGMETSHIGALAGPAGHCRDANSFKFSAEIGSLVALWFVAGFFAVGLHARFWQILVLRFLDVRQDFAEALVLDNRCVGDTLILVEHRIG